MFQEALQKSDREFKMYNTFKTKEKLHCTKNVKRKKQSKYLIKNKNKEKEHRMNNNTTPVTCITATKTKINIVKDTRQETTITITRATPSYQVFLDHSFK